MCVHFTVQAFRGRVCELLSGILLLVDMSLAANNSRLTGAGLDILVRLGFNVGPCLVCTPPPLPPNNFRTLNQESLEGGPGAQVILMVIVLALICIVLVLALILVLVLVLALILV